MKISISGLAASGKSSLAKELAKFFELEFYSAGKIFREIAEEKNLDLETLSKIADPAIDELVDKKTQEICLIKEKFVIEGRLAIYFCPNSYKIFLTASQEVRAQRLAFRENLNFSQALEMIIERDKNDLERYKKIYGIENYDEEMKKLADLVIDNSLITLEETFELAKKKILAVYKK
ncbi:Cytidylate kinase [bacterium HR35]|nr:Cytidylate kinase [bacterium HR35]